MNLSRKIKVNILSPGRYHVLDLARELSKIGFDVKFYSYVSNKRASKFGLRKECNKSLLHWVVPMLLIRKFFPRTVMSFLAWLDFITSLATRKADVTIAMSGVYNMALKKAKRQSSKIIIERGSKHILEQKEILNNSMTKGQFGVRNMSINLELTNYKTADYISIPADHVKNSFVKHDFDSRKLFINAYGVDLSGFYHIPNVKRNYDLIMAGTWCFRKGCDILTEAVKKLNIKLLHVGTLGDVAFPQHHNFTHIDKVDQNNLVKYYNQAKVLVLPSREEGLSLVQAQALACGLKIVCSRHTGGRDLGTLCPSVSDSIFEMQEITVDELDRQIENALSASHSKNIADLTNLSWERYGQRYASFLQNIID